MYSITMYYPRSQAPPQLFVVYCVCTVCDKNLGRSLEHSITTCVVAITGHCKTALHVNLISKLIIVKQVKVMSSG